MQTVSRLFNSFQPHHYSLSLVIDRKARQFSGTVSIEGASVDSRIALHAKDLAIHTVTVDGAAATFTQLDDEIAIEYTKQSPGKHIVTIGFAGAITDAMHGLYPCYFEHNGETKELLATQFESHHAREVFPCVDEPEAKATFDVTLTTEKDIIVLGNQPVSQQREEDGLLVTSFETTPKMSTYLLAWVAGELHRKTASTKSGVEVNVWATPAQKPESLDFALDIATRTIDFFDEYFDTPYPLPKSDHVALPDFSSGAMENWGLVTYREIALLADPATTSVSSKRYIATVITHELSHQWFGNLVTMKWWNNLWLNESFATLMEYIAVDALHPEWNIWLDFASHESIMALRRDAIDGVQAVQVEVNHPDEISTLFDGAIVYAKGARLLRMLQQYIGNEAFQAGLKTYFKRHAYGNTTGPDLWQALSEASGKDIENIMETWVSQPGYPILHVSDNNGQITLSQEQFFVGPHQPSEKLWPLPLNSPCSEMPELFTEKSMVVQRHHTTPLRFNTGDSAHFLTHYDSALLERLVHLVSAGELSSIDRLQLLHEQTLLARGGVINSAELIPLLDAYKNETVDSVWDIIGLAIGELKKFVENDEIAEKKLRTLAGAISKQQYERLGWKKLDSESDGDTKLRATIIGLTLYSEDSDALVEAKDLYFSTNLENLDAELRPILISSVARYDTTGEIVDTLLKHYKNTQNAELAQDIAVGITSTRIPEKIDLLLQSMTDPKIIRSQDVARWFVYLIRGRESRDKAWQWMEGNWQWITDTFAGDKSYDDYPRYSATGLTSREQLEAYKAFFADKRGIAALTRVIDLGTSEIEGRVELIERDSNSVRRTLTEL